MTRSLMTHGFRASRFWAALAALSLSCGIGRADEVDDYIRAQMRRRQVTGLSIAIIQDGKIVRAQGYGVVEKGKKTPVTPDTLFQAGSISKSVAAVGALHLVEQGKLSLDEEVNAKLTSWKVPDNEFTREQKVTLRRILSHTAGLTVHGFPGYDVDAPRPTLVQVLDGASPANTPAIRVEAVPGSRWQYSGGGYTIMQQLVLDVTGKPFPDYMQETVLGPLGMAHSTYQQPLPADRAALTAAGVAEDGSEVKGRWHIYPEMAAAGLWTTPSDLARFAIGIQQARAGKPGSVLSQETARRMLTEEKASDGLGVFLGGKEATLRFSHDGRDKGFDAFLLAYASTGQGAAIMMNANEDSGLEFRIMQVIAHRYHWPDFPPMTPPKHPVAEASAEALAAYAGYYDYQSNPLALQVREGGLRGSSVGSFVDDFLPESDTAFFMPDIGNEVSFDRNDKGEVTGMTWMSSNGHTSHWARIGNLIARRKPQRDPDATRTAHVQAMMGIMGASGAGIDAADYLTPGMKRDLHGGETKLAGAQSPVYIGEDDVAGRNISRHDGKVARVLSYRYTQGSAKHYLLVYVTTQGLITDFDLVDD